MIDDTVIFKLRITPRTIEFKPLTSFPNPRNDVITSFIYCSPQPFHSLHRTCSNTKNDLLTQQVKSLPFLVPVRREAMPRWVFSCHAHSLLLWGAWGQRAVERVKVKGRGDMGLTACRVVPGRVIVTASWLLEIVLCCDVSCNHIPTRFYAPTRLSKLCEFLRNV